MLYIDVISISPFKATQMCRIVLISSSARINEPYKFSNATIKSQRAITRIIIHAHRNCVAACEMWRFRRPRGDRLDEPRKLINIFGKLGYVFRLSIGPNVCLSPGMYVYAYSLDRMCMYTCLCGCVCILRVYTCVYARKRACDMEQMAILITAICHLRY